MKVNSAEFLKDLGVSLKEKPEFDNRLASLLSEHLLVAETSDETVDITVKEIIELAKERASALKVGL